MSAQITPLHSTASLLQPDNVENWFRTDGVTAHPAYGVPCYYDDEQSVFKPGQPPPTFQQLAEMLMLYRPSPSQVTSSGTVEFDPINCSWDEVLDQMKRAKSDLDNDKKPGRKVESFFASAAPYAEQWLELIPDEYGLTVLKGGLALVFATARQKSENRRKIINTFEDLPDIIRTIEVACKVLGHDKEEKLSELAKSFYDQLFKDIPELISILHGKKPRLRIAYKRLQGLKRTVNCIITLGVREKSQINEILERIKKASDSIGSTIERIRIKLQGEGLQNLQEIRANQDALYQGVGLVYGKVAQLPSTREMERLATRLENGIVARFRREVSLGLEGLRHQQIELLQQQQSPSDLAAEAKTFMLSMFQEFDKLRQQLHVPQIEFQQPRQPSPGFPALPPTLSRFDLLRILNVSPGIATEDLRFVLRQASRMDAVTQGRARWLMKTELFRHWLSVPASSILLADGMAALEKISPMSILVSTILLSFLDMDARFTVTIHFFCGRHLDGDTEEDLSGPIGMLRSLISQLLLWFNDPLPNLSKIYSHPDLLRECHDCTLPALCEVFRQLVEQLPNGVTLFCLIDGISWYEQDPWLEDVRYIVGLFQNMALYPAVATLKVLMTSPNRSLEVREMVDLDSQYVSLSAGNVDYMPLLTRSVLAAIPINE